MKCEFPGCIKKQTEVLTLEIDIDHKSVEKNHYYCKNHKKEAKRRSELLGKTIVRSIKKKKKIKMELDSN